MRRTRQRGVAALLFVAVLIGAIAWVTVSALSGSGRATAERETRTGLALQAAKQSLLAYVAKAAADTTENTPGRLPCPESLGQPGTAQEGMAAPIVGLFPTCSPVGRLPWRTLGIDQLRDGSGEPLWYAAATGTWALNTSATNLTINPGTPNTLSYNGTANAVVAVIIAPGTMMNTLSIPGSPPGACMPINQQGSRYAVPYVVANFLECGNETGSYATIVPADWGNDRTISITAAEVMNAIMGAVADRLQRQVAPALTDWRANEGNTNWGDLFIPYASPFSNPTTNAVCGSYNTTEGLMPLARAATTTCTNWTGGTVTQLLGTLGSVSCGQSGGNYQCTFTNTGSVLLDARIQARAPNVGGSFRGRISAANILISQTGLIQPPPPPTFFSLTLNNTNGDANIDFRYRPSSILAIGTVVTVSFPNLPDAALLTDTRMKWFVDNDWARHSYYVISHGVKLEPTGLSCNPPTSYDCLALNGVDLQRFILALTGPALPAQSRSCATDADSDGTMDCNERNQYVESRVTGVGGQQWLQNTIDSTFNDRLATCPATRTPAPPASVVTIC